MRLLFLALMPLLSFSAIGQNIYGKVIDESGHPLAFSSVLLKGTTRGATANEQGEFTFNITSGNYTLVCQHVGYQKKEETVTLLNKDIELTFILPQQKLQLREVVITTSDEDPAYEIMRHAIRKRNFYDKQVKAFECEAYIKGLIKLRNLPNKILGQKIKQEDRNEMRLDSSGQGIIFLSESVTKVAMQQPNKIKLEVESGRQSGSEGFGFNFPTFISLYKNNVSMFADRFNPRGFISPLADGAISFYKFKFLGSFFEDGKEINTIRVTPRRSYEPLFSGTINITEGDWRIHSCDLMLTKTSQLEMLDTLQLIQIHVPVNADVWRVKNQVIRFNFNQFKIDAVGNFVNVYSKYNIDPQFPKGYFDRVIMRYDTAVNKTKEYWDTTRPIPLEPEEAHDYDVKDSLYKIEKDAARSQKTLDSLNKKQGHIKPMEFIYSGIDRTHYSNTNEYSWHLEPAVSLFQYNTVEGFVTDLSGSYQKYLKGWKTNLTITPDVRYGFNNEHLNPSLTLHFRTRDLTTDQKLKRETWTIAGGKRVSQFNKVSTLTFFGNTLSALIFGTNRLKFYENVFGNIVYSKRFENGLRISGDVLYEDRMPLDNTTYYTFYKNTEKFTENFPEKLIATQFTRHQAFISTLELSFKPGQRYIQFPKNKISIGSKYPTLTLSYSHGFKDVFKSEVDFDKLKFTINDDVNLKLLGKLLYKFTAGGYINNRSVFIQDFQHFNGNESILAKEYMATYQVLPVYSAATTAPFFSMLFFEHHFNGLLTNKIPLFKKLNWNLLDGVNAFYVNKNDHYLEVFAGLENIFKVLRADLVAGFRNNNKAEIHVRLGFGGVIGGGVNRGRTQRSRR
ncbi:DUF5686 and carboxypeptidase regulatory-like domain-containing protein [soil metagenome]